MSGRFAIPLGLLLAVALMASGGDLHAAGPGASSTPAPAMRATVRVEAAPPDPSRAGPFQPAATPARMGEPEAEYVIPMAHLPGDPAV